MTTGPSRPRRKRRPRGPRPQEQAENQPQQPESPSPESRQAAGSPGPARRNDGGQQADRRGGPGKKRNRGKRRSNRRPTIGPMPSEVLKPPFRDATPTRKIVWLQLDQVLAADDVQFGCPMLTRTRSPLPSTGNQKSPRCSMGWALHSEQEVALCLRTPDLLDCWKLDPDREVKLRAALEEEDSAAD